MSKNAPGWQLSLVMPAYNEEAGIQQAVAEAHEALAGFCERFEILVVDDGSRDRTGERVAELAALQPAVRLLRHCTNLGYGAALRTGFSSAHYPLVAFTDADSQFHLEDLEQLLALTLQYPIVAGRRVDRQDPWRRRFFSWGYNRLVRTLLGTGVHDCDCALKVFRREVLAHLLPNSRGFFVNAEMLSRATRHGLAIAEVPVRHRPRRHGDSKVSLTDIPRTLATLLPYWLRHVVLSRRPAPLQLPMPVPRFSVRVSPDQTAAFPAERVKAA